MSYCVNCGVELADSEKYCPLCQTEVLNPRMAWKEPSVMPYPPKLDRLMLRIDRKYLAALISTFMLLPIIVTLLSDWLSNEGVLSWSLYVLGAELLMEVWFVLPLIAKRYRLLTFLALDCLAAMAYLLAIEQIANQSWFLPLAFPISLAASCLLLLSAYLFRKAWGQQVIPRFIICLSCMGLMAIVVEVATDLYLKSAVYLNWSPYVLTPCILMVGLLLIFNSKRHLKEEIRKRMFY